MSRAHPDSVEPVRSGLEGTGSSASGLDPVGLGVALARGWAGEGCEAVILGGSHAADRAVWVEGPQGPVCLSDVDLWVIVRDEAAKHAALGRAAAARPGLRERLRAASLWAPLDAGFYTARDLAELPARPATLELARAGRVVYGDPAWMARVPSYRPEQVTREEVVTLLENRGLELLLARPALAAADPLERAAGRHGVLKCAADLSTVLDLVALAPGPGGRAGAEPRARPDDRDLGPGLTSLLSEVTEEARSWRSGADVRPREPDALRTEWVRVARGWVGVWLSLVADSPAGLEADPYERARVWARRARFRRRLRQAVSFPTRSGEGPPLLRRLAFASAGTPVHRLNASATVLLISASASGAAPALGPSAARALARLGVVPSGLEWEASARAVVRAWDLWVLDGQRTGDSS